VRGDTDGFLAGVLPAMVTPLTAGGAQVDEVALDSLVGFLADSGVSGLFVLGTTGEGLLLRGEERNRVVRRTVVAAGGTLPVIAQCGAMSTADAVALAREAERDGAAAIAAYAPPFYPLDARGLFDYFRTIAAAVEIPFVLYQIPSRNGHDLTADLVGEIFAEVPNVIGIKDTTKSRERLREYLAIDGLKVWVGAEDLMLEALELGAVGATSAVSSVVPEMAVALHSAFREGRAAGELQRALSEVREVLRTGPYLAAYKAAPGWRGVEIQPDMRAPLRTLEPQLEVEIKQRFLRSIEAVPLITIEPSEV
jgi:dihydrodipicolinate synthase/N-acetylneuraminate lyase